MLGGLFPDDVAIAWGDPLDPSGPLFPAEEALVANAVAQRRREFAKGRECARRALASIGMNGVVLLSGKDREPLWPARVTGSITHTTGFCAAVVAPAERYLSLGIDAEPCEPLEPEIVARIAGTDDVGTLARRLSSLEPSVIGRLVFTVKEAVYKCQFPLTRTFLGFADVRVELDESSFEATLLVDAGSFRRDTKFHGRWRRTARHLISGTWLRPL